MHHKRERFLKAYEQVRTVSAPAGWLTVHRSAVYRWCRAHAAFVLAITLT